LCSISQVTESTDFNELPEKEPWLLSSKLVVKPDMLFGKRGKSGLVALNLDLAEVASFVKERLGKEVFFPPLSLQTLNYFSFFLITFSFYFLFTFLIFVDNVG